MKRILLKISGEALTKKDKTVMYNSEFVGEIAQALCKCAEEGYQLAIVCGAGNIWRGREGEGMDRTAADRMGMLATVMNSIRIKDAIEHNGGCARVFTSVPMSPFAEPYSAEAAIAAMERGEIVLLGGGLGIPFLSTDTAGAVRAREIDADAMLMAKKVDYIYAENPDNNPDAEKFETIEASRVLSMNLGAIDATASAFCMSAGMPIRIFGLEEAEDIIKAVRGEKEGTLVLPK